MQNVLAVVNSPAFIAGAGFLLTFLLARHPLHALATLLHARAANEQAEEPTKSRIEDEVSVIADQLDSFLADNGKDVKDLVDPATRAAAEAHLQTSAKAKAKSVIDMALTRAGTVTTLLLVCIGLSFANCATTTPPVAIAADSGIATEASFEGVRNVVRDLRTAGSMNDGQWAAWENFVKRFRASYHAARLLLDAATDVGDLSVQQALAKVLKDFDGELTDWESTIAQLLKPDGGAS